MSILLQALMQKQVVNQNTISLSDLRKGSVVLVRGGF